MKVCTQDVVTRSALWAALAAAALMVAGCGAPKPVTDGGADGGGDGSCIEDTDCPDPHLFFCNTTTAKCEPACRTKSDCSAASRGQYALDYCSGSRGCECDEGKCVASLCSADVDCGTQVCRNGQCVAPPAASGVASCQIAPDFVVLKVGAKAKFFVSAWDAQKNPLVIKDGATWAAVGSALTGSGTGNQVEMTAAAVTSGTAPVDSVEASYGTVKCRAKAIVLPAAVPAGQVAVVVTDELTGRPISGAKVMVSKGDGSVVKQGNTACVNGIGDCTVDTDATGYAAPSRGTPAASTFSVTAFHPDYTYTTVANYTGTGPDANYLSIVMRRNQTDKYGGYKGTLKNVPQTSNVHAGIASMSLAGSITNLSITQLLGPSVPTDIHIGNAINEPGVEIPAGVYLGFTDQKIKDKISAQGLAGTCVDAANAADEAKIAAGTCGTRSAWALVGDVPLGDLPIDAFAGGTSNINIGNLLGRITPIFKKFNSSVVRDVQFSLQNTPCILKADGGVDPTCTPPNTERNFSDTTAFTAQDLEFAQVPLAFNFVTKLGDLPKFKGNYVDGALILGGANVVGRGVVPLGIGVGVNSNPVDAQIDKQGDLPAAGEIAVRMAPTHHGLEGSEYGLVVVSISTKGLTDVSAGLAASAIYARVPGNKLVFDPTAATPIDLSAQAFPGFPEGAKYNYVDTALPALNGRTFKLSTAASNVDVIRVSFTDQMEHRWDVLASPTEASAGFTLPVPPGALADRTFNDAMKTTRSTLLVQGFRLNTAPGSATGTAVTFNGLVEFNSTNADRITDMLTAFAFIDYGKPTVSFKTPSSTASPIAKGSKLVAQVEAFKIGATATDDGVVKFSFADTTGGPVAVCPDITVSTEVTAGNGQVEYQMPATCVGTDLTLKLTLMRPDGLTPIAPEVSAVLTHATIQ